MKKIVILAVGIFLLLGISYASSPLHESKEVNTIQELVAWIQNENIDLFRDGIYFDSVSYLRSSGGVLIVNSCAPSSIVITPYGVMNYYGLFQDTRVVVHIQKIGEEFTSLIDDSAFNYFKSSYPNAKFHKINETTTIDGENISYVIFTETISRNSQYTAIGFVKDGFDVRISFDSDEFDQALFREISFELVSLAEPPKTEFTDVQESDWFYEDVGRSIYIPGTSKTTFSPNTPADRATIASALYNTQGELSYTRAPDFVDIDENNPYATAIYWTQKCGIVNGVGDNKFNPDGNVTRQDFAVMLLRYMKYRNFDLPEDLNPKTFADDAEIADYAKEAVYTLNTLGIMNGKGNDIIDPRGNVTRAEAAAMLHRMMNCFKK